MWTVRNLSRRLKIGIAHAIRLKIKKVKKVEVVSKYLDSQYEFGKRNSHHAFNTVFHDFLKDAGRFRKECLLLGIHIRQNNSGDVPDI